jgi:hypothetical protein
MVFIEASETDGLLPAVLVYAYAPAPAADAPTAAMHMANAWKRGW